jgi:hypothetical protein
MNAIFKILPFIGYTTYVAGLTWEFFKYTEPLKDPQPFYIMLGGLALNFLTYLTQCIYSFYKIKFPTNEFLLPQNTSRSEELENHIQTRKRTACMFAAHILLMIGVALIGWSDSSNLRTSGLQAIYFKNNFIFGNAALVYAGMNFMKEKSNQKGYLLVMVSEFCVVAVMNPLLVLFFIIFSFFGTAPGIYITWIVFEIIKALLIGFNAIVALIYDVY